MWSCYGCEKIPKWLSDFADRRAAEVVISGAPPDSTRSGGDNSVRGTGRASQGGSRSFGRGSTVPKVGWRVAIGE